MSEHPYHIAVVEDEPSLLHDLCDYLSCRGFRASAAADAAALDAILASDPADLVLLDVNLPDEDGFSVARRLRNSSATGIVMLTCRGDLEDRLTGLDYADAYLVKQTDLREIEATIRSVLRRLQDAASKSTAAAVGWTLDCVASELITPAGTTIKLTASEAALLELLMATPGSSSSRDEICLGLGRELKDEPDRSIDSLIKRLRKKVEAAEGMVLPVSLVYGVGYTFSARGMVRR